LTSGPWLVISFVVCGVLHAFLRPEILQRALGNTRFLSLLKATVSGVLLPLCSCGVMPLALGLYYSGAYLGPTLAFLVATPVINPAAAILAFALLGPQIATIYVVSGFALPLLVGFLGNKFGGPELFSPAAAGRNCLPQSANTVSVPFWSRVKGGLSWGFNDLAIQTCRFIVLGIIFAALLLTLIPTPFIQNYLSSPKLISLVGITLLGAVMYVCALGHIPFIAALVAAGAAPGVAVTFLLSGVATNLPEMVSIWRLIGKRAVIIYTGAVVFFGIALGYLTNIFLADNFMPQFDLSGTEKSVALVNVLSVDFPYWFKVLTAALVVLTGLYAWFLYARRFMRQKRSAALV